MFIGVPPSFNPGFVEGEEIWRLDTSPLAFREVEKFEAIDDDEVEGPAVGGVLEEGS